MPEISDQLVRLNASLAERYRVERELGHGGMATVWLAHDLKLDRPVALKVLRPELAAVLGTDRFLREVRITARLNHPHILPLLDSGKADGFLYYTMPYVEGETLRARLSREKQLALDEALRIAREVADALSYAHSHDVVHRDIKPENILLESGHAVVADFGIARAIRAAGGDQLTETGIALGTPTYMSPEQAAGSADLDGRSDLYSLGCVLYEMLAGHPPFTGTSAQEIVARHSMDAVPRLTAARPTVSVSVERAIQTALAKVPADRYATPIQFAEALQSGSQAVSDASVAGRSRPARRLVRIAGPAIGIGLLVILTAILTRRHGNVRSVANSSVVVMPFENRTASTELDPLGIMIAEWVTQGLTELPFLTVLDTRGAQTAARTLGPGAAPTAVGRETGAGVVVAGSFILQGDSLQYQTQVSSTTDGTLLTGIAGVAAPRDRPMAGIEELRQRVLAAFASLHDVGIDSFQTRLAHPPSYSAYREYVEGLELYMGSNWDVAAKRFLAAAALDSTFSAPRIWAAQSSVVWWALQRDETSARRADSLISLLQQHREALGPFDRSRLDFVVALRNGNLLLEYQAALRLVDASPGSIDARREAALAALRALRPREAQRRLEELDPERGLMRGFEGGYWAYESRAHHLLGEYEKELTADLRRLELNEDSPAMFIEAPALAALGRIEELDSLIRVQLPGSGHGDLLAFYFAGELMAHGHADAALRLAKAVSQGPAVLPPSQQEAARVWLAQSDGIRRASDVPYCYLGERLQTRLPAERARDEWIHWRAEIALLSGDIETAATRASQLRDPTAHGTLQVRILAAQGKLVAARKALAKWEGRMVRARGTLQGLEIDRASALVRLGDLDQALEVLSQGIGKRSLPDATNGWDGHANPYLAPLFGNPRFNSLIRPRG